MDKHAAGTAHEAIPIRDADSSYVGQPGQTRFESVHLVNADGSLSSVSLCRAINTQTHPELKTRALAGRLHTLDDGRELALPFVYHDPEARKFALVLPASLAHTELKEWSKLMAEIADDTRSPVPLYVRDNTTVIGLIALERYVQSSANDAEPIVDEPEHTTGSAADGGERERLLLSRERELAEQERALIRMAEGLTAREGELNRLREQLETARADLEAREHELLEHAPGTREEWTEVSLASGHPHAALGDDEKTRVGDAPREVLLAAAGGGAPFARDRYAVRSLPPPLPLRSRTGPPPLPLRNHASPPPLAAKRRDESRRSSIPPPLPHHAPANGGKSEREPEPEVAPPAYFAGLRVGQMAVKLSADELWLFVHVEEARAAAYRRGLDMMLQYCQVEGYPVVLLSLLSQGQEPHAIRLALDGHAEADVRVLEHLSRSFRARVALYIGFVYCETLTVAALREGVAQAIGDRLSKQAEERPVLSSAEAMLRAMHAPPPLWNDDLPFGPARREASTPATVLASVEQLTSWLRPEKLEEATLTYCIPRNVIDATIRRVLRSAVAFGIALPDELVQLAIEHRAAHDAPGLVRSQLHAFRLRCERNENDLGAAVTRKNWKRLLEQAEALQVEVDEQTRALALSASSPPSRAEPQKVARPLELLPAQELKLRLSSEAERCTAIRELCVRGHAGTLELVLGMLDDLSPAELPSALASLLLFGEAAGDGLIAALGSPNEALRQLAALALGRLKLRRALLPLLRQLESEESAMYPELARALGDFGPSAMRMLVRSIPGTTRADRLVLALAHLANHGAAKEVEKLENDGDPEVAQAARKAMAKRSRMEWEDLAVREQRSLGDGEQAALLSQAFYAELAKVAI